MASEALALGLESLVRDLFGDRATLEGLRRLPGGASRETWGLSIRRPGGGEPLQLVLRKDPPGTSGPGTGREAPLLGLAWEAGVPVPRVLSASSDPAQLGAPFVLMEHVEGESIPRRILRDESLGSARERLAGDCGRVLAAIHGVDPDSVGYLDRVDTLEQTEQILRHLGEPHPTFELAIRWLGERRPPVAESRLVHGDFRNGNLIVGPDGIRAVLDWELAHLGDPVEDLGWLCSKAWRFGSNLPVGGFGSYDQLLTSYRKSGGETVDPAVLAWWEAVGTLRWGVLCVLQARTHLSGAVRSVELASIGRRVCEQEWDLLEYLSPSAEARAGADDVRELLQGGEDEVRSGWAPHDEPTAAQLLGAVREFLEEDLAGVLEGRLRFHARVAANVLGIVARELALGERLERAYAAALSRIGMSSDNELVDAIRQGAFDKNLSAVCEVVRTCVAAKLAVANPTYAQLS